MVVGYMVRDRNQPFPAAFCILAASTVPAILFARYCGAMGTVVAIRRSMTSLSLLDFWSSIWSRWSYTLGSITKLHCSYYTISMAGREFNSPWLSAEQFPVRLKINLKLMLFPLPHIQYISTHTKIPTPMAKDTSTSLHTSWSLKDLSIISVNYRLFSTKLIWKGKNKSVLWKLEGRDGVKKAFLNCAAISLEKNNLHKFYSFIFLCHGTASY